MTEIESGASCDSDCTRRTFLQAAMLAGSGIAAGAVGGGPCAQAAEPALGTIRLTLTINQALHELTLDSRTTLLDVLREHIGLTGTKKGCNHGQCGTCTVIVAGRRINSCLALAAMVEGDPIITIEGLAQGDALHPMQSAFIRHDAFQCGYCTPGQICSAVAMLDEVAHGMPSAATAEVARSVILTDGEIRERMSGNICRCGAYVGIVAAIREVATTFVQDGILEHS